jgi:hypothetical protein
MGKTVLVTGGSGYLGQHLIHALQSEYKVLHLPSCHHVHPVSAGSHRYAVTQVLYTYNRQPLRNVPDHVSGYQVRMGLGPYAVAGACRLQLIAPSLCRLTSSAAMVCMKHFLVESML